MGESRVIVSPSKPVGRPQQDGHVERDLIFRLLQSNRMRQSHTLDDNDVFDRLLISWTNSKVGDNNNNIVLNLYIAIYKVKEDYNDIVIIIISIILWYYKFWLLLSSLYLRNYLKIKFSGFNSIWEFKTALIIDNEISWSIIIKSV